MVMTVTEILNIWNEMGVFSYVIPFLLIFAVVFAILDKSKILGDNKTIGAIVAAAIGLLVLQFDFVSTFFATIFPRFGVGLSIFLVALIFIGFFFKEEEHNKLKWIGYIIAGGVILWALTSWNQWTDSYYNFGYWIGEYFWSAIILAAIITVIVLVSKSNSTPRPPRGT